MSDFIDFESYDLHGDELLAASTIGGLYAMMVTGDYCGSQENFKNMTSREDPTRINGETVRRIFTEALEQMDATVNSWNPESEMMKGVKRTLQSADLDPELIISNNLDGVNVYVSSEYALTKRTGKLFKKVLELEGACVPRAGLFLFYTVCKFSCGKW